MTTDLSTAGALPLPAVLAGGAVVVMGTAAVLSSRSAARPDLPATRWHRALPPPLSVWVARAAGRRALRLATLATALAGMIAMAAAPGPIRGGVGIAVLAAAALVGGPLARAANPARLACPPAADVDPTTAHTAVGWPAVALLAVLSMLVLRIDDGTVLAAVWAGHLALQAVLCRLRGAGWPARGDPVEALASLVGHIAPVGRGPGGRPAWRNPVVHAAHVDLPPTAIWLTAVVVGLTLASTASVWRVPVFVAVTAAAGAVLRAGLIRAWFTGAVAPLAAAYGVLAGGRWLAPLDLCAFVGLHALAVAVLHRQAIARHDPRTARAVQFPARGAVVVSVLVGLAVLAPA